MIDLHTHSTASDGTEPPAVVVEQGARAGLTAMALTDHDTTLGWDEAAEASLRTGLVLVRGIEVSCSRRGQSVHLLAYLPDPTDRALCAELERARTSRDTRLERMVGLMAADGIPVDIEAVLDQVEDGATAGRPHIADALVAGGIVDHRDEAFARWLGNDSPYYVSHYAPDPVEAVGLVRRAGGVAVVAHAHSATRGRVLSDSLLEEMAAAGMAGIEARHRDHAPESVRHLTDLAGALGLITTGSSDYHGQGKRNRLGENTTSPEALETIEALGSGTAVVRS